MLDMDVSCKLLAVMDDIIITHKLLGNKVLHHKLPIDDAREISDQLVDLGRASSEIEVNSPIALMQILGIRSQLDKLETKIKTPA